MKISIKIRHSVFLAVLLFLTVFILSLVVLDEIQKEHSDEYEKTLAAYGKTANLYVNDQYFSKSADPYQQFLSYNGGDLASDIQKLINQPVVIYDMKGNKLGTTQAANSAVDVSDVFSYAAKGKAAYQVRGHLVYYLTPLSIQGDQAGVIQFTYSIQSYQNSFDRTKNTFLFVGILVLMLSFLAAVIYFNSFANGILQLKGFSERIKKGDYNVPVLKRRDELGDLSQGIYYMSSQIQGQIEAMNEEQRKLNLAVEKLTELEKEQKRFIGNISHEFKTPLTSMRAYLDLVSMYPEDRALLSQAMEVMDKETLRLDGMVDKVLQLSALEKYNFEQHITKFELSELLEMITSNMKGRMEKHGIHLKIELEKVWIQADKENITHIMVNLLDNAIKYNCKDGSIVVRTLNQEDAVIIEVENTGTEIPMKEREQIFIPFYRMDKNRSRKTGGTGLGLSLAKELAEKQGGTIEVKSSDHGITVFQIVIPSENEKFTF